MHGDEWHIERNIDVGRNLLFSQDDKLTVSGTIEKLSEIASTAAAAVEEQSAATQEISRKVQQAARNPQCERANRRPTFKVTFCSCWPLRA
jgi:hypothetical protein